MGSAFSSFKSVKLISTAMAGVMALSLSVPAFADDVKVEGSINLPTINMVLPTTVPGGARQHIDRTSGRRCCISGRELGHFLRRFTQNCQISSISGGNGTRGPFLTPFSFFLILFLFKEKE